MKSRGTGDGVNLDKFYEEAEKINDQLKKLQWLQRSLHYSNDSLRTLRDATEARSLRARMEDEVALALNKAKFIKEVLKALHIAKATNRSIDGCGLGSPTDRALTTVTARLHKKIKEIGDAFAGLQDCVMANQGQGAEIQKSGKGMERKLREIQKVLGDMLVAAEAQEQKLDAGSINVEGGNSAGDSSDNGDRCCQVDICKGTISLLSFLAFVIFLLLILED